LVLILTRRDHSGDFSIDGRIILKIDIKEIRYEDVDWILLAQYRDQWWALVYTAMNFRIP
jgi:hypothetical protein